MADHSHITVTIADIRRAGYCVAGVRSWFRTHNMNFADFLKNGMPADEFIARGDHLALDVVEKMLIREQV